MRYLDFMTGFIGRATANLHTARYTLKWSTKKITGCSGINYAKRAARNNYARGIPKP